MEYKDFIGDHKSTGTKAQLQQYKQCKENHCCHHCSCNHCEDTKKDHSNCMNKVRLGILKMRDDLRENPEAWFGKRNTTE